MRVPEKGVIYPNPKTKGCGCYGIEGIGRGGGPRDFTIHCNYQNKFSTCKYRGNPHSCRDYNKNQRGHYSQLLYNISNRACRLPFGNCPKRASGYFTQVCPDNAATNFLFQP